MNNLITVIRAEDIADSVAESYFIEEQKGLSTGWAEVDKYYTVAEGQLTIVTGVPSHGKSEFIDALNVNLAAKHSYRTLFFSPENYPVVTHIKKLIRKRIGKPYGKMYNGTMTQEEANNGMHFVNDHFLFIYPGEYLITVDDLIEIAKSQDIDGFVIDPWNELDHRRPAGMREDEYISLALGKLRTAARSMGIHIWLIAHPKKPDPGRNYKNSPPGLYDVSGGAHWYNKADCGITVHRPNVVDGSETNIYISKIRFRNIGKPTGDEPIVLNYNIASGRYYE